MHYGKYPVHLGANRGRGQTLQARSNNTVYNASAAGTITKIAKVEDEDGSSKYEVSIQTDAGETVVERIPRTGTDYL